jgi:hypothetical protein
MDVIEPTIDYDFSNLYLGPPTTLSGGAYFTRVMYNNNKQLYIQTPKSLTKQGFVKNGKKIFTDLMFDNNDTVFINWIENLETKCQDLIFTKGQNWFENKLERDDIESAFTSPFKIFKSGKYYLLRINVKQNIKIYDEKDQIINIEDISSEKTIISILEIQGIKFTSRNFQLEIELKQAMVVSPDPFLDECFIKKPTKQVTIAEQQQDFDTNNILNNSYNKIINESAKDLLENTNKNFENEDKSVEDKSVEDKSVEDKSVEEESLEENNSDNNILPIDLEVCLEKDGDSKEESENIVLDVEELTIDDNFESEDPNSLKEVNLTSSLENNLETITLKKPNQVYYEIYQKAREKAKEAKKNAVLAYLEMKNIKKTYMLDDIDNSDSELEEFDNDDISDDENLENTLE